MQKAEHSDTHTRHVETRRQQILDAAAQCFRKSGFHAASMAEIAKSFGMSAGHIYNYFENKEAIIEALVERDLEITLTQIAQLLDEQNILNKIIENVDDSVRNRINNSAMDIEIVAEASRNPKVAKIVQTTDAIVRGKVYDLLRAISPAQKKLSDIELTAKTDILMALFDGLMMRSIRHPEINKTELGKVLRTVIQHMFSS